MSCSGFPQVSAFFFGASLFLLLGFCPGSYAQPPSDARPAGLDRHSWPPKGVITQCPITRDTGFSSVEDEISGSNGGAKKLKLKGILEHALLDIDPLPLRGRLVTGALLHLRSASPGEAPLARVGVSSIASSWVEGSSASYKPQAGSSCFNQAELSRRPWAYDDGNVMDVSFGHGHTVWRFADCSPPDAEGWQACAVDPDVVAARIAGLSHGFLLQDEVGNTWSFEKGAFQYNYFPNRFFYSRESGVSAPWLEVWTHGTDTQPPLPVAGVEVQTAGLPPGEAFVSWKTPEDQGGGRTLGFHVSGRQGSTTVSIPQHMIPMAGAPGQDVRMHLHGLSAKAGEALQLSLSSVDSAGNIGKSLETTVSLAPSCIQPVPREASVDPFPPSSQLPKVGGLLMSVVDSLDKIDPAGGAMTPAHGQEYSGGNHLFSGERKLIRLQGARNEWVSFQLSLAGRAEGITVDYAFETHPNLRTRIYQSAYVKSAEWNRSGPSFLPDPLVPLEGPFSIPSTAGLVRIPGQDHHTLLCELYIPHDELVGPKTGRLTVRAGGEILSLAVELTVWNFALPDRLSFVPEMNAYGGVSPYGGYEYYRLAHEHRTCINRLPYGWDGMPAFAPVWNGSEFDWTEWDSKVGPLLDGSAFRDLPRDGEPVDVLYMPFNENWPVKLDKYFRCSYWADEAFTEGYAAELVRAFSAFARHCNEKRWHKTIFQFYLNNKITYRKDFPKAGAPWIFDEPVNTQDFWALRWYGLLWRAGVDSVKGQAKMWYRGDISYSQFGRNLLQGIMDVQYLGDNTPQKLRMKCRLGGRCAGDGSFAEYGSANGIPQPNTQPVLWCIDAWAKGAVGVLPWQTMGSSSSWNQADQNALFYPRSGGAVPSLRLKAFTRGQQDVEYFTLYSEAHELPRRSMQEWLSAELNLEGRVVKASPADAGTTVFRQNDPVVLWRARYAVGSALSNIQSFSRRVRHFSEVSVDSARGGYPGIGEARPAPGSERLKPACDRSSL